MRKKQLLSVVVACSLALGMAPISSDAATKLKLKNVGTKKTMYVGKTFTIKTNVKKPTFKSSKKSVATVSKKGVIKAKKKGTTVISVKKGAVTKKVKVTVKVKKANSQNTTPDTSTIVEQPNTNPGDSQTGGTSDDTQNPSGTTYPEATKTPEPTKNPGSSQPYPTTTPNSGYTGDDSKSDEYIEPKEVETDEIDSKAELPSGITKITIPAVAGAKIETENYKISKKNKLTILAPGEYEITTENYQTGASADATIEIDYAEDEVTGEVLKQGVAHLYLNGVKLDSSANQEVGPDSDTGVITVKKNVERAVLTIVDGSETTLVEKGLTGVDKDDATDTTYPAGIVSKKTPLTINGKGKLTISSQNGNAVKSTDSLKIIDTEIVAGTEASPVGHNGITAKKELLLENTNVRVVSVLDTIKTTLDESDIKEDPGLSGFGTIDIQKGTYSFTSVSGDGLSAASTLSVKSADLSVYAKNAKPGSDDSAKAVKAKDTVYFGSVEKEKDSTIVLKSEADDTVHSNGYVCLEFDGAMTCTAGDDGIHADKGLQINKGTIDITKSYEGLEAADITINGGDIAILSSDDGINAAGGNNGEGQGSGGFGGRPGDNFQKPESAESENYQLIINGGKLYVNAAGDGLDSNGNLFIRGGFIIVDGPTNSGNGALDYGDFNAVCEISGGTLVAAGATGMDVAPTSGSTQPAVRVRFSSTQAAGTTVVIRDSSGKDILASTPKKQFQSIVMSCPEMKMNESYSVYTGKDTASMTKVYDFSFTSISVSAGSNSSGGGWGPGRK